MRATMLAALGAVLALGAALEAHRRDMRRIELTDARMDAYRAGQAHGARTEAARIAAEAEAQADDALDQLEITEMTREPTGAIRVVGYVAPGAVADALRPSWPPAVWKTSEELDAAVAGLIEQLRGRRPEGPTP